MTAPKHILHLGLGGCIPPPGCGFPHHNILARQVGAAWLSLDHRLGITMFQVASARGPELARQAPASAGWRQRVMLSQLVIKQVWGEHSFNKSQLAAYLTHVRKPAPMESRLRSHQARSGVKPTPVALSRLWWLSPAESRLRSHPPTLHLYKSYP